MKRLLTLATTVAALSLTIKYAHASQLPFPPPPPSNDPSFPQKGLFDDSSYPNPNPNNNDNIGINPDSKILNLADTLTVDRKANVWWDYARPVTDLNILFSGHGKGKGNEKTTLLVPVDSAIMKMGRKPHQYPDGGDDEKTAENNVKTFLKAHIVPGFMETPSDKMNTMLEGLSVEIVEKDGGYRVNPGDIAVLGIKDASNGRILYLDSVVPY